METRFTIISDHGDQRHFSSVRIPVRLNKGVWAKPAFRRRGLPRYIKEVLLGFKLWHTSVRKRGNVVVVTGGGKHTTVFAILQGLCKPLIRPKTHFIIDFLLDKKRNGIRGSLDQWRTNILRYLIDKAVIWGATDVELYHKEYGLPKEKLVFHPFHITTEHYAFDIRDEGYLFAGGNGGRDYRTLIEAVKDFQIPCFLATTLPYVKELARAYPHIVVEGTSPAEFRQKMAGCRLFVECHDPNFFRTAGHQTFLNAMWMGKPVVLADLNSAVGYLEDGVDALIVPAADVDAVREKIKYLLDNPQVAGTIANNAKAKAHQPIYRTLNHLQSIYNLALTHHFAKQGLVEDVPQINFY